MGQGEGRGEGDGTGRGEGGRRRGRTAMERNDMWLITFTVSYTNSFLPCAKRK